MASLTYDAPVASALSECGYSLKSVLRTENGIEKAEPLGAALVKIFPRSEKPDLDFIEKCRAFQEALQAQARSSS